MSVCIILDPCGGCGRTGNSASFRHDEEPPDVCWDCQRKGKKNTGKGQFFNTGALIVGIIIIICYMVLK